MKRRSFHLLAAAAGTHTQAVTDRDKLETIRTRTSPGETSSLSENYADTFTLDIHNVTLCTCSDSAFSQKSPRDPCFNGIIRIRIENEKTSSAAHHDLI